MKNKQILPSSGINVISKNGPTSVGINFVLWLPKNRKQNLLNVRSTQDIRPGQKKNKLFAFLKSHSKGLITIAFFLLFWPFDGRLFGQLEMFRRGIIHKEHSLLIRLSTT